MTPDQYCQDKAAKSGSSFYYAFRFLPEPRRLAITALYAYCREVDDVVDECHDEGVARTKLAWWRDEVERTYAGDPQHPVMRALKPGIDTYGLPKQELLEILDGMAMDLDIPRYNRFDDLLHYCHCVAGVVGKLSARIFGHTQPATLDYAHELGIAFQLTNITRDVGEDIRRGRLYLPVEELQQFNVPVADIQAYRETDNFRKLMEFQIDRAERYYRQARDLLPAVDRKSQRPGLMMAAIYLATLREIRLDGPTHVLNQKLSLPPLRKLLIAWRTWWFGFKG